MEYKNCFIFVAGTTPQIITETLYALHHRKPPIHPDELCVLTTSAGKERIEKALIMEGRLEEFYKEFGIRHCPPRVVVMTDSDDAPLDDIKTDKDNEDIGDFIANFVKEKAAEAGTRLLCSIAGGRKTMSFYLGAAMGLFGRPRDRLYHVLVTPEFESHHDFFWKPGIDRTLEAKDFITGKTKKINTKDAEIILAELPFIRLRDKFQVNGEGFRELVKEGQREIDIASAQLPLKIDLSERLLEIGPTTIEMIPMQIVIYNAFLREKIKRCRYPERKYCRDCVDCFPFLVDMQSKRIAEEMAGDYRIIYPRNPSRAEEFLGRWKGGIEVAILRQNISKINRTIRDHLDDETLASYYVITAVGRHGNKRHGVRVEKGKIEVAP